MMTLLRWEGVLRHVPIGSGRWALDCGETLWLLYGPVPTHLVGMPVQVFGRPVAVFGSDGAGGREAIEVTEVQPLA